MSIQSIARIAFKRDGEDFSRARAAFAALGGDPAALDRWLPDMFAQFGALAPAITAVGETLLTLVDPDATPDPDPVTLLQQVDTALDGSGSDAVPAFRAAVDATTLGGGYGGDATTDELQALLVFVATNLPS